MTRNSLGLLTLLLLLATGCATPLKGRHVYSVDVWGPQRADLKCHTNNTPSVTTLLKNASLEDVFAHMQTLPPEDAILLVHFTKPAHMNDEDRIGEKVAAAALKAMPPQWIERARFHYCLSDLGYNPWYRLSIRTGQYIEDADFDW
jgi:hypothetical protein